MGKKSLALVGLDFTGWFMAMNPSDAGYRFSAYATNPGAAKRLGRIRARIAANCDDADGGVETLITMLPPDLEAKTADLENTRVLEGANPGSTLVGSSCWRHPYTSRLMTEVFRAKIQSFRNSPVLGDHGAKEKRRDPLGVLRST